MPKLPEGSKLPTPDEQLTRWVAGDSICPNTRDECCPDFSCCKPELLQSLAVRQAFHAAGPEMRHRFLGSFLGAAVGAMERSKEVPEGTAKKVAGKRYPAMGGIYIAGGDPEKS